VNVIVIDWFAGTRTVSGQNSEREVRAAEKPGPDTVSVSPKIMPLVENASGTDADTAEQLFDVVYQDP